MADQNAAPVAEGAASPEVEPDQKAPAGEGQASREEIIADPDAALAAEEEAPQPKKKKLKLGDKEVEFDEDIAKEIEERDQVYQKRKEHIRAANKKFEEAAALEKKFAGVDPRLIDALRNLESDPFAVHKALGRDPDALVTEYAKQKLAELEMTPEQRALAEKERAFAERERQIAEREQKIQQEQYQREVQRVQADFAKNLPPALEKHGLPDDEFTAGEIGKIIAQQIRGGREPDYDEAAEIQAERLQTQMDRYLDRLSRTPGALKQKYPELAKRLREEDVASVTAPRAVRPGKPTAPQSETPRGSNKTNEDERLRERHPWAFSR